MQFEIDLETQDLDIDANLVRKSILATLKHQGVKFSGEVSVLCVQDAEMARYNKRHRGKDATTDVLSFPQFSEEEFGNATGEFICLGDIIINIDAARRQADEYDHSLAREIAFLTVHSTLHLLGYNHDDEAQETRMFAAQEEILLEMGLGR